MARLFHLLIFPCVLALPWNTFIARDSESCGGNSALSSCGSPFPNSFCCAKDTTCISINDTSIVGVICCPNGSDCSRVEIITCDINLQNASQFPASPIHTLNLTASLPKCGSACCPLGFECQNNACVAVQKSVTSSPNTAAGLGPPASITTASTTASKATAVPSPSSANLPDTDSSPSPMPTPDVSKSTSFSGKPFAAGFIPGILIGALLFGLILWLLRRRRSQKRQTSSYYYEKPARSQARRQISNPVVHPLYGQRTAFVRMPSDEPKNLTPPYKPDAEGSAFNPSTEKFKVTSLFHRSPNPTNTFANATPTPKPPPIPSTLGCGSVTPPYALRKKLSDHSLRRYISNRQRPLSRQVSQVSRISQQLSSLGRKESGETIKIRMSSPRISPRVSPPPPLPQMKPLFPPSTGQGQKQGTWLSYTLPPASTPEQLGTPYTPSKYGDYGGPDTLSVPPTARTRDTTFSGIMRKAGIKESDLLGRS